MVDKLNHNKNRHFGEGGRVGDLPGVLPEQFLRCLSWGILSACFPNFGGITST